MRQLVCQALAALALAAGSTPAHADASAFITLNGRIFNILSSTGADGTGGPVIGGAFLQPGQSQVISFTYSITVQEDGLASTRQDTLCADFDFTLSFGGGVKCIAPTGFEVAAAGLTLGNTDARHGNPLLGVSGGLKVELRVDGPSPTFKSQSGTVDITVTNFDTVLARDVSFGFSDYVIVDSVPEPETYAMLLAGLALLSWRARRLFAGPALVAG
jgi:hypothetical protein